MKNITIIALLILTIVNANALTSVTNKIALTLAEPSTKILNKSVFYAGNSYNLEKGITLNSNLYVATGDVKMEGKVIGDANIAAGNATIVSDIGGDLSVLGGNVNISSNVKGDLKVLGGRVFINGNVGGDLLVLGGKVYIASGTKIGGESRIYDQEYFRGQTDSTSQNKITQALILLSIAAFLILAIGSMIMTFVLYYIFRGALTYVAMQASDKTWKHLRLGVLILLLVPLLGLIIALTGVGAYLSVLITITYLLLIMISNAVAPITLGAIISRYIVKRSPSVDVSSIIIGSLTYTLLSLIPIVGLILRGLIFIATFAVLGKYIFNKIRE